VVHVGASCCPIGTIPVTEQPSLKLVVDPSSSQTSVALALGPRAYTGRTITNISYFTSFFPLRNRRGTGCPRYVTRGLGAGNAWLGEIGVREICVHSAPVQFLPEFIPRYLPWVMQRDSFCSFVSRRSFLGYLLGERNEV
jgi:hypothetical protein